MCEYFDKAISYTGIHAIVRTNCSNIRNPTGMQFIDSYVHAHADMQMFFISSKKFTMVCLIS